MKRILLLLLICSGLFVQAQVYNNEWIDYSKTYYKFKINTTGLYRISQSTLSGLGLGAVNADYFQIWRNGEQLPLYTSTQGTPLDAGGHIEFWGEMNDGKPDNPLYRQADFQISDRWSLQTDTAAFFLTVNPADTNKRLVPTTFDLSGTLTPEPYFTYTVGNYFKNKINTGRSELVGTAYTYSSSYDYGEGYTSADIARNATSAASNFTNLRPYTGSGAADPYIRINAAGNAMNPRYFRVNLNTDSIHAVTMNYYDYVKNVKVINISQIAGGSANIQVINRTMNTATDRMVVGQVELTYPRLFNFNNQRTFTFDLPANASESYLEISNFDRGSSAPVLYDLTNGKRYVCDISTPALNKVKLQPSLVDRKLVLVNQMPAWIGNVTLFEQRNFVNYLEGARQGDFLIITNALLTDATSGGDPAEEYRQYRSSGAGGSYNAKVYLIDQLVDQFAFGIKMHPLSIRNFLRWARATYSSMPRFVLILGKGVTYNSFRTSQSDPDMETLHLVPTFGYPASDNLLSAEGGSSIPITPIGRISAINKTEIRDYLEKVKQYEQSLATTSPNVADQAWRKNVVHVTGASDDGTTNILLAGLNGHKRIIEDSLYAGKVTTFTKNTADAVQQLTSTELTRLFSNGIGLLTYFGHSSSSTLEFNLQDPLNYNNTGRYPVMIVMGCNAGNFYNFSKARLLTHETISERYIMAKEKGSVAFLASTHLGIVHYLDIYNTRNYRAMSLTHYGESIGEIMDEAIRRVFQTYTENDFYARFQCEQFTMHGDPAIKLYTFEKPDYAIEDPMVSINPKIVSVADDHFTVNASFTNLGKALRKSMVVEVKRTYPNMSVEVIKRDTILFTRFEDSLSYEIPIVAIRDKGLNKITLTLDADNEVEELYETNNVVVKEIFISEDNLLPVFPYNYSIINEQNIKFTASTANPFAPSMQYRLDIDTTEAFNSPVRVSVTTTSVGGIVEFSPSIVFTDSTVYYWRVGPSAYPVDSAYTGYSFQYIQNGSNGFSQAHYFQHKTITGKDVELKENRVWDFTETDNSIYIRNGVWATAITQGSQLALIVNDARNIESACDFGFIINVFDGKSLRPWENQVVDATTGLYNSRPPTCDSTRRFNFEYANTSTGRKLASDFLKIIPEDDLIVVRLIINNSATNERVNSWIADQDIFGGIENTLYYELKSNGFVSIDSMYKSRVFTFVYKRNATDFSPLEQFSEDHRDPIQLNLNYIGLNERGKMTSALLGPAKSWDKLYWKGETLEATEGDRAVLDIYGVRNNGLVEKLIENIAMTTTAYDMTSINASVYPKLRLEMRNIDSVKNTPYQLRYWMLTGEYVPEGAISPNLYFTTKDTVESGEPFDFGIAFKNISSLNFDSVKVKLAITDKNNIENIIPVPRQKKLLTNDTIKLNVRVHTRGLSGNNVLFVNFNPDEDQPEQSVFNNYAFRNLYVRPDSINPLLDVTFDGVHILNRDIIASKPAILIKLKDESKWMVMNDTSALSVQVRYPDGVLKRYYYYNNSDTMRWVPAGEAPTNDNSATIDFTPYFDQDGEYELIVTGRDQSDNFAGAAEYRVAFQVINKPMISNMLNYPNPFTTSTAFVFTLTGSEVPPNIRIQILTVTGKIVREITKQELGPLRIGRNITEYKWDGTDQYGQKLANGVYLYRVITTGQNGKRLDKYKSEGDNTDKYFNKGYGKMYLMR